jgi:toxin ParE1/3/4
LLASAQQDLKDIRHYVTKRFGPQSWKDCSAAMKASIQTILAFPEGGTIPDELVDLHLAQYRQAISGMNRIIYEVRDDTVYIHVICDTRRDMRSLLARRLLTSG